MKDIEKLIPSKEVLSKYPEFSLKTSVALDKVLTYLTSVYHHKSPLAHIGSIIERKYKACELAEMPKKKDKFTAEVEEIILGQNVEVNKMTIAFCRLFRNPSRAELIIYYNRLFKDLEQLERLEETPAVDVKSVKDKADASTKILANIRTYKNRIAEYTAEFLLEDNSRMLLTDLYEEVSENALSDIPIPETVAQQIKDGKLPLRSTFNPYEL